MTASNGKFYQIDASPGLIKRAAGQAAVTATGYIGTQHDQGGAVATDMACIINVEAINVAAGSIYTFRVVGSNVADRSDGQVLGVAQLGLNSVITIESRTSAAGDQRVIEFRTMQNFTQFRFVDLHLTIAGGSATITFNAHFAKRN